MMDLVKGLQSIGLSTFESLLTAGLMAMAGLVAYLHKENRKQANKQIDLMKEMLNTLNTQSTVHRSYLEDIIEKMIVDYRRTVEVLERLVGSGRNGSG